MNFDISHLLDQWDYQPGQAAVRKFMGKDGVEKIQLRVDLGLLQMNSIGRPDGKRPRGFPSLFEYYQAMLHKHVAKEGNDNNFRLNAEDCAKMQLEAFQYHNRYNCLLQLKEYAAVVRDTERNLAVFDFVQKFAQNDDLSWSLQQFRPQLLMILTRARAGELLHAQDYSAAIQHVEEGISMIKEFCREHPRQESFDQNSEANYLKGWLEEIHSQRPLSKREKLEKELNEAVDKEDYERAAQMRDALRSLKPSDTQ